MIKKKFYEKLYNFCQKIYKKEYQLEFAKLPNNLLGLNSPKEKKIIINKNYKNDKEKTQFILKHEICHIALINHTLIFHIVAKHPTYSEMDNGIQTVFPIFYIFLNTLPKNEIDWEWINDNFCLEKNWKKW